MRWIALKVKRITLFILVFIIGFLIFPELSGFSKNRYIHVDKNFSKVNVLNNLVVFEDKKEEFHFTDISSPEFNERFNQPKKEVPSFGYTKSIIWLKLYVKNLTKKEFPLLIEIDNPLIDTVTLFYKDGIKNKTITLGDKILFNKREIKNRNVVFPISLQCGKNILYLKVKTSSNSNIPIILWSHNAFFDNVNNVVPILWMFYGLLFVMIFYNLFIYFVVKDVNYLYYVLFISSFFLFRFAYNGYAFQFLWPGFTHWANLFIPISVSFVVMFSIQFTRSFLEIKKFHSKLDFILRIFLYYFILMFFLSFFIPYGVAIKLILFVVVLVLLILIFSGIISIKTKKRESIFYLVAWMAFLVGSILNILRDFGIIQHSFISFWAQQIGTAIQVVLLSLGLADKINQMKDEIILSHKNLQRDRERLEVILKSIDDAVVVINFKGKIIFANDASEKVSGFSKSELAQRPINDFLEYSYQNVYREIVVKGRLIKNVTLPFIQKNGNVISMEFSVSPLKNKEGKISGYVVIFRDITDRKRLEETIINKNKLDALGTLAGGIAHDFNNMLTSLVGNIGIAKISCKENFEALEVLSDAEAVAFKAKGLSQQLLTFAKGGVPVKTIYGLKESIVEIVNFNLRGSKFEAVFDVPDDLWKIHADEGQIAQVINNLVINAKQSMKKGGKIFIKLQNINLSTKNKFLLHEGKYIRLSVKDMGEGIKEENLFKIFDPFFTTKKDGNGLGLSSAYFIIKQHKGGIFAESIDGQGATFHVLLPAVLLEDGKEVKSFPSNRPLKGTGRILLMDDLEDILKSTSRILLKMGYEVVTAKDGQEAIDIFKEYFEKNKNFDVIILDLTIPGGMGGRDTVVEIKKINPDATVIASSGYSNDPIMADFKNYGFDDIILKPYTVELLLSVVRKNIKS